jgi:hypothetical protein
VRKLLCCALQLLPGCPCTKDSGCACVHVRRCGNHFLALNVPRLVQGQGVLQWRDPGSGVAECASVHCASDQAVCGRGRGLCKGLWARGLTTGAKTDARRSAELCYCAHGARLHIFQAPLFCVVCMADDWGALVAARAAALLQPVLLPTLLLCLHCFCCADALLLDTPAIHQLCACSCTAVGQCGMLLPLLAVVWVDLSAVG